MPQTTDNKTPSHDPEQLAVTVDNEASAPLIELDEAPQSTAGEEDPGAALDVAVRGGQRPEK